jgi:N-methylhydantoinase B
VTTTPIPTQQTTRLDPFTQEIVKDKLAAIADEMGVVLARTSMSPIVYEVLDFACGITDPEGHVISQTNGLTLFTGTFRPQVDSVLRKFAADDIRPGDVYMTNDPYTGGTHICDVCLVAPVFWEEQLAGFAVTITHWIEIGGAVPGSIPPDATEIYQEGLVLPCLRVARDGKLDRGLVDLIEANVRLPRTAIGDLNAGIAALRIGERGILDICARYGAEDLGVAARALLDHGEAIVRQELLRIPDGVYEAEDVIDGDGVREDPVPIRVKVTVDGDRLTADFTGSAPCSIGPVNCSRGALESACKTAFRAITVPQARSNDGCFRPFEVICPAGTVFTAELPTPTGWYYEATAFATELIWKAMAPALPQRLGAGSYVSLSVSYIVGRSAGDGMFVLGEPNNGGWGASDTHDGQSGLIATTDGDTYNFPVEVVESRYPVRVERYALDAPTPDGAGRRRGGLGLVREYRVLHEDGAAAYGSMGGWRRRPWGIDGGREGGTNHFEFLTAAGVARRGRVTRQELAPGDVVRIVTATGGGYGDPRAREPELVLSDVLDGYIDVATARDVYGVELDPERLGLDAQATDRIRGEGTPA